MGIAELPIALRQTVYDYIDMNMINALQGVMGPISHDIQIYVDHVLQRTLGAWFEDVKGFR